MTVSTKEGTTLIRLAPNARKRVKRTASIKERATARLEARISTDLHTMVKRAAELQGRSMTDFVIVAVRDAAQLAIERAEVMRLSRDDQECFAKALIDPPSVSPALQRGFARRRELLRSDAE